MTESIILSADQKALQINPAYKDAKDALNALILKNKQSVYSCSGLWIPII